MLNLYNTLTKKKDLLEPIETGKVRLYTCGPTVYDYAHIGNLRMFIFYDVLERTLEFLGYGVHRTMNLTDVGHLTSDADEGEDKMDKAVTREHKPVEEIIQFYIDAFLKDAETLNIQIPKELPRASHYIKEQIELIETLFDKGYAYDTPEAIYFNTSKFENYGALSGQTLAEKLVGAREEVVTETSKKNPADFALWFKLVGRFEHHTQQWDSPWGKGFPGWHLECSALIKKFLGQPIDIHAGGVDHIGTHHTNEIAQSEAAYGIPLAHLWLHGEHLLVDNKKMAKSDGGFYVLKDVIDKGFSPLAFRYLVLTAHYRSKINFTWESLEAAQRRLNYLNGKRFGQFVLKMSPSDKDGFWKEFCKYMSDDLNTSAALAVLNEAIGFEDSGKWVVDRMADVLGLRFTKPDKNLEIPNEINALWEQYKKHRANKQFAQSDGLREKLNELGYTVQDNPHGPSIIRKTRI